MDSMADAPYLVALALVEIAGNRALPLTGKSQAAAAADAVDPGDDRAHFGAGTAAAPVAAQ